MDIGYAIHEFVHNIYFLYKIVNILYRKIFIIRIMKS